MPGSRTRLKDKVSEEEFNKKAEKKWNTVELTEDEVERIKKKSKKNMSPKSLQNLVQYNKNRSLEGKKKSLENVRVNKSKDEIDKPDVVSPRGGDIVTKLMPVGEILDKDEIQVYENYLNSFLSDFKIEELSQSDIDDVIQLSVNKVLEFRLLKKCKGNSKGELDVIQAIERIRKYNDKIKENLAARRRDRIVPKNMDNVSIVDIAAAFDKEKKREAEIREAELLEEERRFMANREFKGNREDEDIQMELNEVANETREIIPEL
jgi:hypothetical protein